VQTEKFLMADQHTTGQGAGRETDPTYNKDHMEGLLPRHTEEQGSEIGEKEDSDMEELQKPFMQTHKIERQIKSRLIRELSMSRDERLQLPCCSWSDNGDDELWIRPGKKETIYHSKRVKGYLIDYSMNNLNNCYTCMDHRKCDDHLCMARRLSSYYCKSEEGPLPVREKQLAKGVVERAVRYDRV